MYRFFNADEVLLYIGICDEPMKRWGYHTEKQWWPTVMRFHVVWFPSRAEAAKAEEEAIVREKPRHNVALNGIAYNGSQFPVVHLHRLVCERFGDRSFTVRDLVSELGIPRGSAVAKTKQLRDEGLFQVVGITKGARGQSAPSYRAVPKV